MREPIQDWFNNWLKGRGEGAVGSRQIMFMRDEVSHLVWKDVLQKHRDEVVGKGGSIWSDEYHNWKEEWRAKSCLVISEHTSKSVRLPVYLFDREDLGLKVILRENFHGWNLTVVSKNPIPIESFEGISDGGTCYFEGFPEEFQCGTHQENPREFSLAIGNDYRLYAFLSRLFYLIRETKKEDTTGFQNLLPDWTKRDPEFAQGILRHLMRQGVLQTPRKYPEIFQHLSSPIQGLVKGLLETSSQKDIERLLESCDGDEAVVMEASYTALTSRVRRAARILSRECDQEGTFWALEKEEALEKAGDILSSPLPSLLLSGWVLEKGEGVAGISFNIPTQLLQFLKIRCEFSEEDLE